MKRFRNLPLRVWVILPFTLVFSLAIIHVAWNIPYFITITTTSKAILGMCIAAVAGYFFLLRLLIRPGLAEKLRTRTVRIGAPVGVAAALGVMTVYLAQQIPYTIATISKVVLGLSIAVVVAGYFCLLLLIRPGLIEKLKTRPVRIGVTVVVTAALIALTIHTVRFLPSPEAAHILSKVMAILLLATLISAYPLILRYIWRVWRREDRS